MARVVVSAVVGIVAGVVTANPYVGFQAFALTYGATGFLDPATKVQGPRLDDLKGMQASEGVPIPYIEGVWRTAGTIIWSSEKQEVATTESQSAKGGPDIETTTYTYKIDVMYLVSINQLAGVRRIWSNGKLVWSAYSDDPESQQASLETNAWEEMRFHTGALNQLPDPDYEAAVGVGNAPAYRGRATIFIKGLNLGSSGYPPVLNFEVFSQGEMGQGTNTKLLSNFEDASIADVSQDPAPTTETGTVPPEVADGEVTFTGDSGIRWTAYKLKKDVGKSYTVECLAVSLTAQSDPAPSFSGPILTWTFGSVAGFSFQMAPNGTDFECVVRTGSLTGTYGPFPLAVFDPITGLEVIPSPAHFAIVADEDSVEFYYEGKGVFAAPFGGDGQDTAFVELGPNIVDGYTMRFKGVRKTDARLYGGEFDPPDELTLDNFQVAAVEDVPLDQLVERICVRSGLLAEEELNVAALADDTVRGVAFAQGTYRQALEVLMGSKLFESVETGGQIKFVKRGGASVMTAPFEQLGATTGEMAEPLPIARSNDQELPAKVFVRYSNFNNDYQDGNAVSDRLITQSGSATTVEFPVVMTPTEALRVADSQITDLQVSLVTIGPISLSRAYAALEPADVVIVEDRAGSQFRARIIKITDAPQFRTLDLVLDDASAINSTAVGDETDYSTVLVRGISPTAALFIDGPIARDADNDGGFYVIAKPSNPDQRWTGGAVFSSPDGVTYTQEVAITERGVFGSCLDTLGPWDKPRMFDEVNTLTVDIEEGTLTSSTRDALLNDQTINACAVGSVSGGWEYLQFRTATSLGDGAYRLSGFLRGSRGTEWKMDGHTSGESFGLLRAAGVRRVDVESSLIGVARYYKVPSINKPLSSAAQIPFVDNGVGLKPFSPFDARKSGDEDVTISWQRRTRFQPRTVGPLGISIPLGETVEAYSVDILDGSSDANVIRTLNSGTTSVVYTQAMQTADGYNPGDHLFVRIYQLSSVVGRGYPLEAEL